MGQKLSQKLTYDAFSVQAFTKYITIKYKQSSSLLPIPTRHIGPFQNFLLIWLDPKVDENKECDQLHQKLAAELHGIVFDTLKFKNVEEFIARVDVTKRETCFLIVSGPVGKYIVPKIHDMNQLNAICIFSQDESYHKFWAQDWSKVLCVSGEIQVIYDSLKYAIQQTNHDAQTISFTQKQTTDVDKNPYQLDSSYLYTMLFKEIILDLEEDEDKSVKQLVAFCRNKGIAESQLNDFETRYHLKTAIWWYTSETFLYNMLNKSLRDLDIMIMVKLGFIIKKLHIELVKLHRQQSKSFEKTFTVYRGQGMTRENFRHLVNTKGGLLAFNYFLSTSTERSVAISFMQVNLHRYKENIGVLYIMDINQMKMNPKLTPFALIKKYSAKKRESEMLFSMHTLFRVIDIKQSEEDNSQWEVQLTITNDRDPRLGVLGEYMVNDSGEWGWYRLGKLMLRMGDYRHAEDLYSQLLADATNDADRAFIYHMLGTVQEKQGKYEKAIVFYEKTLQIERKTLRDDDPYLATTYNNIAVVYNYMGEYRKALDYCDQAHKIKEKVLRPTDPELAASYLSIGFVYNSMGDHSKALEYYNKAHEIYTRALPLTHPDLAASFSCIGAVHREIGDFSKALEYYGKALEIREKALPNDHPDLATSYNEIGVVYSNMSDYLTALEYYEKALKIREKALPNDHPDLATSYNEIGVAYSNMDDYSKSLEYHEKALVIDEKTLHPTHPTLATTYNNIGMSYFVQGNHHSALLFLDKALTIRQKTLHAGHPLIKESIDNMNYVKNAM